MAAPNISVTNVSYPKNSDDDSRIVFKAKKWQVKDNASKSDGAGQHHIAADYSVSLYIPQQVEESHDISWSEEELGGLAAVGLDEMIGPKGFKAIGQKVKRGLAESISQGTNLNIISAIDRRQGNTRNPRAKLLFQSPQRRQFSFSFMLSPKNEQEVKDVQNIIRIMKFCSLPGYTEGNDRERVLSEKLEEYTPDNLPNSFFTYPYMFDIKMVSAGSEDTQEVIKYKTSVVTQLNFDYTPESVWAQFKNGYPVDVQMDVTFQELEYFTREDVRGSVGGGA